MANVGPSAWPGGDVQSRQRCLPPEPGVCPAPWVCVPPPQRRQEYLLQPLMAFYAAHRKLYLCPMDLWHVPFLSSLLKASQLEEGGQCRKYFGKEILTRWAPSSGFFHFRAFKPCLISWQCWMRLSRIFVCLHRVLRKPIARSSVVSYWTVLKNVTSGLLWGWSEALCWDSDTAPISLPPPPHPAFGADWRTLPGFQN